MRSPRAPEIGPALDAFLRQAEQALEAEHVLPRPAFSPWMRVGHDYFGDTIRSLDAYATLEETIKRTDDRFSGGVSPDRDFASGYMFDALEFYVALRTLGNPDALAATADALWAGLLNPNSARTALVVTDLVPEHPEGTTVGAVTITALNAPAHGSRRDLHQRLRSAFGARVGHLANDLPMVPMEDAALVLSPTEKADGAVHFFRSPRWQRLSDFVLAIRLLKGATVNLAFAIDGSDQDVGFVPPYVIQPDGWGQGTTGHGLDFRRPGMVRETDAPGVAAVVAHLERRRDDTRTHDNIGIALGRFQASHLKGSWADKIIDLSIALEAALSGSDPREITFRLQTRAVTLLSTERDSPNGLFDDVKHFYAMRSTLVHGATRSSKSWDKLISRISRVDHSSAFLRHREGAVVDRLRDIVRRAILCRLFSPDWPSDDAEVDRMLVNEEGSARLRTGWRLALSDIGQSGAWEPVRGMRATGGAYVQAARE